MRWRLISTAGFTLGAWRVASLKHLALLGLLLWNTPAFSAYIVGQEMQLPAAERQVRVTYFHAPGKAKRPAALLLHGGGSFDRRIKDYSSYASVLANAGIDAYLVYYYGDGQSAFDYITSYVQWAKLVGDLADHLQQQPQSNGKVGLVGFSNGGILAAGAAALDPNINAAVIYYGAPPYWLRRQVDHYPPLLILHGDADAAIPADAGRELAHRAEEIGTAVDLVIYPEEAHGFGSNITARNGADALSRTVAFLQKQLLARTSPTAP